MSNVSAFPLVAVDVGNSRVKCGFFENRPDASTSELPQPARTSTFDPAGEGLGNLGEVCGDNAIDAVTWRIASVQRNTSAQLVERLREFGVSKIHLITSHDLPLKVVVPRPDRVGVDRLLGAVAANHLRNANQPAIVVHVGSAITVNLVAGDGSFRGGAILPGIAMAARAMHQFTDLLPLIDMTTLNEPPPAVGDGTHAAMTSGLFWGAVGGIRQLIELCAREVTGKPLVILTGGAAPSVAQLLPGDVRYERHLVLSGIALAAAYKQ